MDIQTRCSRCVLDLSAKEIVFTETGCNFCDAARESLRQVEVERHRLPEILVQMRRI